MITYLDPVPAVERSGTGYDLRLDAADPRILLLANGFPGSVEFLDELRAALVRRLPGATFATVDKPSLGGNASMRLTDEQVEELLRDADALVTAYGH